MTTFAELVQKYEPQIKAAPTIFYMELDDYQDATKMIQDMCDHLGTLPYNGPNGGYLFMGHEIFPTTMEGIF